MKSSLSVKLQLKAKEGGGYLIMSYNTFLAFGGFIGTRETDKATIDDFPFRLHYKVATAIVFLASALISATELVGKCFLLCLRYIFRYSKQKELLDIFRNINRE